MQSFFGLSLDELGIDFEAVSSAELREQLGKPVEARYAATHEGALHLDDVLTRRTRISIETFDRGTVAARPVAKLMGEVLGWDEATFEREIQHYEARVNAERDSQTQPDDLTADAARLGAPDVRMGGQGSGTVVQLSRS